MSASTRAPLVVIGLVAAILGGGLRAWLARGDGAPRRRVAFEPVDAMPRTEPRLAANPRGLVPGASRDRGEGLDAQVLRVRVVEAESGGAVMDAALSVVQVADPAASTGLCPTLGTLGSAASDREGRASVMLRPKGAPGKVSLRVSHPAYVTEIISDWPDSPVEEILVRLSKGRTVAGIVADRSTGRGVEGLTVTITPRELPDDVWGTAMIPGGALRDASALTDSSGAFQCTVPDGTYVLRAGAADWSGARQRPGTPASHEFTIAEAGDTSVRIEVERVMFVRFELRDSATRRLVTQSPADFLVVDRREDVASNGPGALLGPTSVWLDGAWVDLVSARRPTRGLFAGAVPARPSDLEDGAKPTLRIALMVPGYRRVSSALRLLTATELRSGAIDTISLVREGEGPWASMLVKVEGPPFEFGDAGPPHVVLASESGDILRVYGTAEVESGVWRVEPMPVGRFRVHVYDNARRSAAQSVDLGAEQEVVVTFQMPAATGILVDVHAAKGPRLADPEVWAASVDGMEMRLEGTMERWSSMEAMGSATAPFFPLAPGSYKISVYARGGWGWYAENVDLVQGQVSAVRGLLRPPVK